jgi:hypothetical protein
MEGAIVNWFMVLSRNLPGITEENHENPHLIMLIFNRDLSARPLQYEAAVLSTWSRCSARHDVRMFPKIIFDASLQRNRHVRLLSLRTSSIAWCSKRDETLRELDRFPPSGEKIRRHFSKLDTLLRAQNPLSSYGSQLCVHYLNLIPTWRQHILWVVASLMAAVLGPFLALIN